MAIVKIDVKQVLEDNPSALQVQQDQIIDAIAELEAVDGGTGSVVVDVDTGEVMDTDSDTVLFYIYDFIHLALSDNADGSDFDTDPTNHTGDSLFIGIANSVDETAPVEANSYSFTEFTWGASGFQVQYNVLGGRNIFIKTSEDALVSPFERYTVDTGAIDITDVKLPGPQGQFELSVYRNSTTLPATPTNGSYTFSTDTLVAPTAPDTWTLVIADPGIGENTYQSSFTYDPANDADVIDPPPWSVPVQSGTTGPKGDKGDEGDNGNNGDVYRTIYLYNQAAANLPTVPAPTQGFVVSTGAPLDVPGTNWTVAVPNVVGSNLLFIAQLTIKQDEGTGNFAADGTWDGYQAQGSDGTNGINGNPGADGSAGPQFASVILYTNPALVTLPPAPNATITWSNLSVAINTTGWSEAPPTQLANSTLSIFTSRVLFADPSGIALTTTATGDTPVQGTSFSGIVTFDDGNFSLDNGVTNITTIDGANIATGTISADEIAANAINAEELNANAVTSAKILAGAVTAAKIDVAQLSAISADVGVLTAGTISGLFIEAGIIVQNLPAIQCNQEVDTSIFANAAEKARAFTTVSLQTGNPRALRSTVTRTFTDTAGTAGLAIASPSLNINQSIPSTIIGYNSSPASLNRNWSDEAYYYISVTYPDIPSYESGRANTLHTITFPSLTVEVIENGQPISGGTLTLAAATGTATSRGPYDERIFDAAANTTPADTTVFQDNNFKRTGKLTAVQFKKGRHNYDSMGRRLNTSLSFNSRIRLIGTQSVRVLVGAISILADSTPITETTTATVTMDAYSYLPVGI